MDTWNPHFKSHPLKQTITILFYGVAGLCRFHVHTDGKLPLVKIMKKCNKMMIPPGRPF